MAIVRILWNLAPVELFTQPSPNFKYLARRAIGEHLKLGAENEQLIRDLAVVFKRIRFFYRYGRNTTSFDASNAAHLSILRSQSSRCALCLFPFEDDLDLYAAEEESVVVDRHTAVDNEIRLKLTYRRPELDHIIPHLLGGDDPENWQILCRSCNAGKSDVISGLSRHFSHSSVRTSDFSEFGASKRFAVIADYRRSTSKQLVPDVGQFLRVFRKNRSGFLNIENLCCELC